LSKERISAIVENKREPAKLLISHASEQGCLTVCDSEIGKKNESHIKLKILRGRELQL